MEENMYNINIQTLSEVLSQSSADSNALLDTLVKSYSNLRHEVQNNLDHDSSDRASARAANVNSQIDVNVHKHIVCPFY